MCCKPSPTFTDPLSKSFCGSFHPKTPIVSDKPSYNFFSILADLDRSFALQLYRIKSYLYQPVHACGARKPDLAEQEEHLLATYAQDLEDSDED